MQENKKNQPQKLSRTPFQALNNGGFSCSSSTSSSSSSSSSLSSVDAPKCCLRFFIHHSSSTKSRFNSNNNIKRPNRAKHVSTPKSAPVNEKSLKRSVFYKPISKKFQKSEQNNENNCKINVPSSRFSSDLSLNGGSEKNTNSATKTPPIQASVSPEIQCGSSMVSSRAAKATTPVCYGAGYVVSGVSDKRKCRPRGTLTVKEAKPLDCDFESEKQNTVNSCGGSMVPLLAEASIHWLLSPCNEEDGDRNANPKAETVSCQFRKSEQRDDLSVPDPANNCLRRSSPTGRSPEPPLLCSGKEKSPLGSGNVIQTPQSDFSTDSGLGVCRLKADSDTKIGDLSPQGYVSEWDPTSLSFRIDYSATSPSNSSVRSSWFSNSRVSWKEGLVSRIFEMDEFDSCRCFSDDDDHANGILKPHCSPEAVNPQASINGSEWTNFPAKVKEKGPCQVKFSCAKSISTEEGGLASSDDSDWRLCYKNQLFQL